MKKILVGLSGGVDSAVSAYLLKKQGYDVTAGFMINYLAPEGEYCPTRDDIEVAKEVAAYLDIPFFTFDYREDYALKVLGYMYEGYKKGITPNPDIMCNSEVKFKVFLDEALAHGFDGIAMGHYARIVKSSTGKDFSLFQREYPKGEGLEDTFHLLKGVDANKDQSYFLAGLNQFQLSKALFPIGEYEKSRVREIAREAGLPNAERKDSQGICFVGKVDLTTFLEKKINPKPGKILDTSGKVLGEHKGVFYYTIGQRKGLDLGGQKEPVFIVKKDIEKNEIVVGTTVDLELYDDKLFVKEFHFLSSSSLNNSDFSIFQREYPKGEGLEKALVAKCKIRYRQADQDCTIFKENDRYRVEFKDKQRAIASGQICAVYIGDELVMSGVIN
ncbi:MAG: tRNA 2-thiouridine(34) synthase MnmA [Candidatus Gracilibacteria bacterium]|nr:tRNA 2-thiouridine(34) synthase MnmA [Candidatus Gracilibacteria bacterium]